MKLVQDIDRFDVYQVALIKEITQAIAVKLVEAGLEGELMENTTANIAFSVASILDDTTRIEADGGRAIPVEIDVSKRDSLLALADRVDKELGGANLLVNNAGVLSFSPVREPEERGWRWIVDVNLFGVV